MTNWNPSAPYPNVVRAAAVCLTVWILYVAQDLIIPITIATLISFVLAPSIRWLKKIGIPAVVSSAIVTSAMGLIVLGVVALTSSQLLDLSQKLPQYRDNLVQRIRSIKSSTGHSLTDLHATVATLQNELEATTAPSEKPSIAPVPVKLVETSNDWITSVGDYISPAIKPLALCSVVLLLVFFILMSLDLIYTKSQRLARRFDLYQASEAFDEASVMLGKYLRAQLMLNLAYGTAVGLTMMLFGLPNYLMWGILAAMLRYLPYIGPATAVILPTLLSIAITPDWNQPLYFLACLLGIEFIVNVLVEPMLYGHRTGVSSLGVIVSTLFWCWLWGGAGLLLAMPITACLVVIGKHLRPLQSIADLLGSDDPTPAPVKESETPTKNLLPPIKVETLPS